MKVQNRASAFAVSCLFVGKEQNNKILHIERPGAKTKREVSKTALVSSWTTIILIIPFQNLGSFDDRDVDFHPRMRERVQFKFETGQKSTPVLVSAVRHGTLGNGIGS